MRLATSEIRARPVMGPTARAVAHQPTPAHNVPDRNRHGRLARTAAHCAAPAHARRTGRNCRAWRQSTSSLRCSRETSHSPKKIQPCAIDSMHHTHVVDAARARRQGCMRCLLATARADQSELTAVLSGAPHNYRGKREEYAERVPTDGPHRTRSARTAHTVRTRLARARQAQPDGGRRARPEGACTARYSRKAVLRSAAAGRAKQLRAL
jgi:hypothetical protein